MKTNNILDLLPFDGIKTAKVISNNSGDVILIAIEQGKELTAHKSNTDASVLILEGVVKFKINGGVYDLLPNDTFAFKKDELHAIEAITNAKLILIKG